MTTATRDPLAKARRVQAKNREAEARRHRKDLERQQRTLERQYDDLSARRAHLLDKIYSVSLASDAQFDQLCILDDMTRDRVMAIRLTARRLEKANA